MDDSDDQARQKWLRDFNDLEDERAGRNNGRIKRFFPQDGLAPEAGARNDTAALMLGFAAQHEAQVRLARQIDEAERAADLALEEARRREQAARDHLDQLRENATRAEDGRTVFLTADGKRAFDEYGNELTPAEIAAIDWIEGSTTWEQWQKGDDKLRQAAQDRQEIEAYRERVRQGRDRLESGHPLTAEESESIRRDIEAMPESVRVQRDALRQAAAPEGHNPQSTEPRASAARHYEGEGIQAQSATPAFARAAFALAPDEIVAVRETPVPAPKIP